MKATNLAPDLVAYFQATEMDSTACFSFQLLFHTLA